MHRACTGEVALLSIRRCRKVLGRESPRSDTELERLRNHLYALGSLVVGAFSRPDVHREARKPASSEEAGNARGREVGMLELTRQLGGDEREAFEERAAILEFDGGVSRSEAEKVALEGVLMRRRN